MAGRVAGVVVLVEETRGGGSLSDGGLVVPNGGVDNDGLHNELGLGDQVALHLERGGGGERAEKDRGEDVGGLHFDFFLVVVWVVL